MKFFLHSAALGIIALVFISFFYFHLYDYFTLDYLRFYHAEAAAWTSDHYALAVSIYLLVFTLGIACALPCATLLTLVGGFLFDTLAIIYAEFCITLGGLILFLAVRTAIGGRLAQRSYGWIRKLENGFRQDAFNYLLSLRLLPVMPCWVSNIGAGILNVPAKTFILATALGVLPSTIIYVLAGRGLDTILSKNLPIRDIVLTPWVLFPLLGLALLSLFPVVYRWLKKG